MLRKLFVAVLTVSAIWFVLHHLKSVRARQAAELVATHGGVSVVWPGSIWTRDISNAPLDAHSAETIAWLSDGRGWGYGRMLVNDSIRVVEAGPDTQRVPFEKGETFYAADSDLPASIPLPAGGGTEGEYGYDCPLERSDCHLIVVDRTDHKLYEAFQATEKGGKLSSAMVAEWDLSRNYGLEGRGEQCTSADAAGFPIAPLLFNADELAAGHIDHAIRFILPNGYIRQGVFVPPATHVGSPRGPEIAPPMGALFRLRADFDMSRLKPAAQVVARAMQKYGMYLSDGGNVALTAQSDADTLVHYDDVDFGLKDLTALKVSDFEVVASPPPIPYVGGCKRAP